MLYFKDFSLISDSEFLAMQFDNETRRLEVFGDFPADWSWEMMVTVGDNHDILPLSPFDGGVGRNLTRDNLSIDGLYDLQLRGTYGEKVQHTNQITVQVFSSQSGDANWPEIPTSFSDAEERIKEYNDHPPTPGVNGFWMIWNVDTDQYELSDIPLPSGGGGGMNYQIGHGLKVTDGYILEVDTTDNVEADNTLPITASAVFQTVGNIEILLGTI